MVETSLNVPSFFERVPEFLQQKLPEGPEVLKKIHKFLNSSCDGHMHEGPELLKELLIS